MKEDKLGFNWVKDEEVYCEPDMNGGNSRGKDAMCKIYVFCTFYIKLDVVCICMEANWIIRDKVKKGNYINIKELVQGLTLGEHRVLQDGKMNGLSEIKLRKFGWL